MQRRATLACRGHYNVRRIHAETALILFDIGNGTACGGREGSSPEVDVVKISARKNESFDSRYADSAMGGLVVLLWPVMLLNLAAGKADDCCTAGEGDTDVTSWQASWRMSPTAAARWSVETRIPMTPG